MLQLERAIFADPRKLFDKSGSLKPVHTLDDDTAVAMSSLEVDEIIGGTGAARTGVGRTTNYAGYYNELRTHRSLTKDTPLHRIVERLGAVSSRPILGGLHHQYCQI